MLGNTENKRCCYYKTNLYSWGANSHGQLGLGFVSEQVSKPMKVDTLPDNLSEISIAAICGGGGHSLLRTVEGFLYGAGRNDCGQVGNLTQSKAVVSFEPVRGLEGQRIVDVACGWSHTVALSDQGRVWVWGSNAHFQLGFPVDEVPYSCLPICLNVTEVVSIAAGLRHTVVATRKGSVYSWGEGLRGQLGHIGQEGKMIKSQPVPKMIDLGCSYTKVKQVFCGQKTTYAINDTGQVLAWGDNKWGQLVHDPRNVPFFFYPIIFPSNFFGGGDVVEMTAGWTHCAARTKDNGTYLWGRGDYGQLGVKLPQYDEQNILRYGYIPYRFNGSVVSMECGSEHTLALVKGATASEKKLVSFGWNEHGNCGNGDTENLLEPFTIPLIGEVRLYGCGAAHSFAVMEVHDH